DYLHHVKLLQEQAAQAATGGDTGAASRTAAGPLSEKERKRLEAQARQERSARQKPIKTEIARIEQRIAELETVKKEAEAALADPELYADFERARPHLDAFNKAKAELEGLYERWEEQQLLLENAG